MLLRRHSPRVTMLPDDHISRQREKRGSRLNFRWCSEFRASGGLPYINRPASCLPRQASRSGQLHRLCPRSCGLTPQAGLRERNLRRAACLVLILLAIGCLAAVVPLGPPSDDPPLTEWRRTADGWVRTNWTVVASTQSRPLHPAVVGLFQALAAVTALVAFPPSKAVGHDAG